MKKSFLIGFLFLFGVIALPAVVQAEEAERTQMRAGQGEEQAERQTEMMERQEQRQEQMMNRCDKVEEAIAKRLTTYNENQERHVNRYARMKNTLTNLATKLEAEGYDTAELTEKLRQFDAMSSDFYDLVRTHMAELALTQDYACGESEGAFKEQLLKARETRTAVLEQAKSMRQFYQDEIRPLVQRLRTEIRNNSN